MFCEVKGNNTSGGGGGGGGVWEGGEQVIEWVGGSSERAGRSGCGGIAE